MKGDPAVCKSLYPMRNAVKWAMYSLGSCGKHVKMDIESDELLWVVSSEVAADAYIPDLDESCWSRPCVGVADAYMAIEEPIVLRPGRLACMTEVVAKFGLSGPKRVHPVHGIRSGSLVSDVKATSRTAFV